MVGKFLNIFQQIDYPKNSFSNARASGYMDESILIKLDVCYNEIVILVEK